MTRRFRISAPWLILGLFSLMFEQRIGGRIMTKSTKCSVCTLPSEKLGVVDQSLRDGTSLQAISDRTGLSKSSLWRHSRHIAPAADSDPPPTRAVVARNEHSRPQTPAQSAAVVPSAPVQPLPPIVDRETALAEALDRAELLFSEALEGLEASKTPVSLTKGDGTTVELPGDLRSRAAFIRAGRDVLDQLAKLRGLYDPSAAPLGDVVFQNVILLPKIADLEPPRTEPKVIDVQPEPAALPDGGTRDREDT